MLRWDAEDPGSKRGGKLLNDRKLASGQARFWLTYLLLVIVLLIALLISDKKSSPDCNEAGTCDCTSFFSLSYYVYLGLTFVCVVAKVNLGFC